ncbi:hypothetical protein Tco_1031531 [Tanacetum coccineum]|uniref:Uncharacterized protein n=1 Tax=Tanacetum coccineum TaxID=301880 RepID=A0ABQ5G983_9ASTR
MFDEYLEPPNVERPVPPAPAVQVPVVLAGTPSSTTIDQDALSTSYSPSSSVIQPPISHQGVAAGPTIEDNPFAQANNDPFVNVFAPDLQKGISTRGGINLRIIALGCIDTAHKLHLQIATSKNWCIYQMDVKTEHIPKWRTEREVLRQVNLRALLIQITPYTPIV